MLLRLETLTPTSRASLMSKKYYQPLRKADISIQFHGAPDEPQCTVTVGRDMDPGDFGAYRMSSFLFSRGIASLELLDDEEKHVVGKTLLEIGRTLMRLGGGCRYNDCRDARIESELRDELDEIINRKLRKAK